MAERKVVYRKEDLEKHFNEFNDIMIKYGIDPLDVYNMDKTGFWIRVIIGRIVIIHLSTKAVYLVDPDNRESLTVVETICVDSNTIPLILILKGDVLLKKYFENDLENNTLLTTSLSRYSNKGLIIKYLIYFYNNTYKKTKGK